MKITREVFTEIIKSYPNVPPEEGGIIGRKNGIICKYFHDNSHQTSNAAVYVPDVKTFNSVIQAWSDIGIEFGGIVHSHISSESELSSADKDYICSVFKVLPKSINKVYFPIILPDQKKVFSYAAICKNDRVVILKDKICVID